jgi:predicted RND superfamily exporter protein
MRQKLFLWLSKTVVKHNVAVLIICAIITIAMMGAAGRIKMKTQFSDMMPEGIPQIEEFEQIVEDYESISTIMIAVESDAANTDVMKQAAEEIVSSLKDIVKIKPAKDQKLSIGQRIAVLTGDFPVKGVSYDTIRLVRRIDYKVDKEFMSEHGMIIQKPKDLENMIDMFGSLELSGLLKNINDNFEKEFVEDSENLNTLDGEAQAVQGLEGVYKFVRAMGEYVDDGNENKVRDAVNAFVSGPDYFISSDNTLLLLMLQPGVSWEKFEEMLSLGYHVVDSLRAIDKRYPDLYIGSSGSAVMQIDEMEANKKDFGWPSLIALILILFLLIGSFKTWKNPFFSVSVLVIAIIWVAGILGIVLEFLNMMSAAFGIILIGLGIDFGIHFISGFRDGREQGHSVPDAIKFMYKKMGAGVITGGSTTAMVFFSLALARFKTYTEMGISIGLGIVVAMIAFFVLLPALIVWDNKGYSVIGNGFRKVKLGFIPFIFNGIFNGIYAFFSLGIFRGLSNLMQFRFLESMGRLLGRMPVAVVMVIIGVVTVVFSIRGAFNLGFEYDMMKLQPQGTTTMIVQDKIVDKFEIAPDYAMLLAENIADCRDKIEQLKKAGNRTDLIGSVDGITEFLAPEDKQEENIETIKAFRKKLEAMPIPSKFIEKDLDALNAELKRLHQNIVEIGELSIAGQGEEKNCWPSPKNSRAQTRVVPRLRPFRELQRKS